MLIGNLLDKTFFPSVSFIILHEIHTQSTFESHECKNQNHKLVEYVLDMNKVFSHD